MHRSSILSPDVLSFSSPAFHDGRAWGSGGKLFQKQRFAGLSRLTMPYQMGSGFGSDASHTSICKSSRGLLCSLAVHTRHDAHQRHRPLLLFPATWLLNGLFSVRWTGLTLPAGRCLMRCIFRCWTALASLSNSRTGGIRSEDTQLIRTMHGAGILVFPSSHEYDQPMHAAGMARVSLQFS